MFFYKASLSEDLSLQNSSQILEWCTQDDVNIDNLYNSIDFMNLELQDMVNYYTNCVDDEGNPYVSCFENFIIDLKLGYIYLRYLSYVQSISDDILVDESSSDLINLFIDFYTQYPTYDIMNDKSNYSSDFSLTYKNITSVISNLYLQSGNYDLSCEYGKYSCPNLECDGNILNLIDCLDSF